MANSPVVTSLPAYVDQNRDLLVSTSILGSKSAKMFTLQSGIKSSAALNILTTDIAFGDGASCGWDEAGTQTLSQRTLVTGQIKINMAYCDKKLLGKWAEHEVRIAAGQKDLPFEEDFTNEVVIATQEALEKAIWQGDTASADVNLKRFDGMLKILGAANGVITEAIAQGTTAMAAVKQVVLAIPAKAIKDDTVVFCSPEFALQYSQEMVAANLYHYDAGKALEDFVIPATNIRLVPVGGLAGTKKLVAGRLSNFFFGCDLADDAEKFELWYSQDNREFRLAIEFNAGVQVAFPAEVVLGTIA